MMYMVAEKDKRRSGGIIPRSRGIFRRSGGIIPRSRVYFRVPGVYFRVPGLGNISAFRGVYFRVPGGLTPRGTRKCHV